MTIYGEDDRVEIHEASAEVQKVAQSVAAVFGVHDAPMISRHQVCPYQPGQGRPRLRPRFVWPDASVACFCVGPARLARARRIAKREAISLSAVFVRAVDRELEAEQRRAAFEELVHEIPRGWWVRYLWAWSVSETI